LSALLTASTTVKEHGDAALTDRPFQPATPGFLLLNASLDPIYLNLEVVKILSYPETTRASDFLNGFLRERIRTIFGGGGDLPVPTELISGRRRYVCRKLTVNSLSALADGIAVVVLLDRNNSRSFDSSQVAAQFHLRQRERETMELLVHGFTIKEIAYRMGISPNTVKVFLRLIMVKMNVTTRSGLVTRVFESPVKFSMHR
jgi:DNA-binding CsgD family transcriptional regulator